jgi:hypothetical protein
MYHTDRVDTRSHIFGTTEHNMGFNAAMSERRTQSKVTQPNSKKTEPRRGRKQMHEFLLDESCLLYDSVH